MNQATHRIRGQLARLRHQRRIRHAIKSLSPTEFIYHPEPTTPGDYARGLRLLNGEIFHENQVHNLTSDSIWDYHYPSAYFVERMNAFDWMDDLASVKTEEANRKMRNWCQDWIERFGRGEGMGWRPDLLGWRIIHMITHATTLLANSDSVDSERYFESLGIQTHYLRDVANDAEEGLPRIVCYVAWLFAALALDRFHENIEDVVALIDEDCADLVEGNEIYLYSRNPEELSQIFCLLVWTDHVMEEEDYPAGKYLDNAIDVLGRALRALRFANRELLPAHGGGTGDSVEIERALANAQIQGVSHNETVLGFRNIRAASLNAFFDCAPPPSGDQYAHTHASTLGLWVAERDQLLFGAGGSPISQPVRERIEAQETPAHSTLSIAQQSSSELTLQKSPSEGYTIGATIDNPATVFDIRFEEDQNSLHISASHNGFRDRFGYTHQRKLVFDRDGLFFGGLDILQTETRQDEKRVEKLLGRRNNAGIPVDLYFHLGPNIEPSLDMNGESVSFLSELGYLWVFRQEGGRIEIHDNYYYQSDRIAPTPTQSIIVRTRLMGTSGYVTWSMQAFHNE